MQAVAQPLHHRAADEHAAFERVRWRCAWFGPQLVVISPLLRWLARRVPVCISMKQPVP